MRRVFLFVKNNNRRVLRFLGLGFFLLLLIIFSISLRGLLHESAWNGSDRLTGVVMVDSQLYPLVVYSYEENRGLVIMPIPADMVIPVSRKLGEYHAKSLKALAEQEGDYEILKDSLSFWGGFVIDYIVVSNKSVTCTLDDVECFRSILQLFSYQKVHTSLSFADWWRLTGMLRAVDSVHVSLLELSRVAIPEHTEDNVAQLRVAPESLDRLVDSRFTDGRLLDEKLTMMVVSTYPRPQAASRLARVIAGLGGQVTQTQLVVSDQLLCEIRSLPVHRASVTVTRLLEFSACTWSELSSNEGRADIEVWMGKNFIEEL